jgi:hypothetical protein
MKISEFRKLIREEVRKIIKEAKVSIVPSGKLGIKYKEDEGLLDAVKKKYKVTLKKKMPSDVADMPLEIYKIENTPYIIVDEAGFGAIYNESDYNKVIAMIKDETYFEMDESKKKVVKEANTIEMLSVDPKKIKIDTIEAEGLLDAVKAKYKVKLMKKVKSEEIGAPARIVSLYTIGSLPYFLVDEEGFGAIFNTKDLTKVIKSIKDSSYFGTAGMDPGYAY